MRTVLITPPGAEPVGLVEVKKDLRVGHGNDDADLTRHITAARQWVELRISQKLITQTWDLYLDAFPPRDDFITIPFVPVQEIVAVDYDDPDDAAQTWAPENYVLGEGDTRIRALTDWPVTHSGADSVRIRFTVGYGAAAADVPGPIRSAISLKVGELYDGADNGAAIDRLLWNYLRMVA